MKFGDKVMLKSEVECRKIDESVETRLGVIDEMIFGEEVTILKKERGSFKIKEDDGVFVYSYEWISKDEVSKDEEVKVDTTKFAEDLPVEDSITFKLDDTYSEPTKMYLKATGLAIEVMERIRVENPDFWELLEVSGARDNFFREILADDRDQKSWRDNPSMDWKLCGFESFFIWHKSLMGFEYWKSMGAMRVVKRKPSTYHFIDDEINLEQICSDTIKDGKITFMVEGQDEIFVGWMAGEELMSSPHPVLETFEDYSLAICTISKEYKAQWEKTLQSYATNYVKGNEERNEYLKDRDRKKEDNRFNVTSW